MNLGKVIEFEGCVLHLYLDSKGVITCGVGHACPTFAAVAEIGDGWDNLAAAKTDFECLQSVVDEHINQPQWFKAHRAEFYKQYCQARMTREAAERTLISDMYSIRRKFILNFPDYESFPVMVKNALDDMAFNLGPHFPIKRNPETRQLVWPKFTAAIKSRNWALAAEECHRSDVSEARNFWTKEQFSTASTWPSG